MHLPAISTVLSKYSTMKNITFAVSTFRMIVQYCTNLINIIITNSRTKMTKYGYFFPLQVDLLIFVPHVCCVLWTSTRKDYHFFFNLFTVESVVYLPQPNFIFSRTQNWDWVCLVITINIIETSSIHVYWVFQVVIHCIL